MTIGSDESSSGRRPGRVGPYRLERELGRGSYGVVFEARREGLLRPVALKVLTHLHDAEARARFLREAQLTSGLEHPHVVGCFDVGQDSGRGWLYLALELAPGGSLAERLARGPLAPDEAATLVAQLCGAVAYAHARGVLHRDIKPANVLFDREGRPLLSDFGLATHSWAPRLTGSLDAIGTPAYMAPELWEGRVVDPRVDVYSLGAVLYHALTGEPPYAAATVDEVARLARAGRLAAPSTRQPGVSPALDAVCRCALARDPGERYLSAERLAAALREAVAEPGWALAPAGPRLRRGAALAAAGAVAVLLLGGAAAITVGRQGTSVPGAGGTAANAAERGREERPPAPPPVEVPPVEVPPVEEPPNEAAPPRPSAEPATEVAEARPAAVDAALLRAAAELDEWGFVAAERALEQAQAAGAEEADLASARARLARERAEEERLARSVLDRYVRDLRGREALEEATASVARRPGSAELRRVAAHLLAVHGRYRQASEALREAARRDTAADRRARLARQAEALRGVAPPVGREPSVEEDALWAQWDPLEGAQWRLEEGGVVRGRGVGLGDFSFAGLLRRDPPAPAPPYTLSVEIELDTTRPTAYGGLILGAQGSGEAVLVYVLCDRQALERQAGIDLERVRARQGAYPKALRVARLIGGRWQGIRQLEVAFPDVGWTSLEVRVEPGGVTPVVAGQVLERVAVPGPPAGRVGIHKFYDDATGFRRFRLAGR